MAGKVVVLLLLALCVAVALGDRFTQSEYQSAFTEWMGHHNRSYTSSEFAGRFSTFKAKMDFIDEHNQRNLSYTLGLNQYSDMSTEEFSAIMTPVFHRDRSVDANAQVFTGEGVRSARTLPTLDWRTKGAVTPVKNQGQCGSCWTFATTGSVEAAQQIATGTLPSLSEQNLLDCVTNSNGCSGGSFESSYQYIVSNGGIDTESSYAYKGVKGTCAYNAANSAATLTGWNQVATGDENALYTAVTQQPVAVGIQGDLASFQSYRSGTYHDASCGATINHAVIVIGYGTDSTGTDYWLIKNSWGTSWGIQGVAQLRKGVNECGITSGPAFPSKASTAGWVWQDNLYTGWSLAYSGTVTGFSESNAGVTGVCVSASVAPNSKLIFSHGSTAYSLSGFKSFSSALKVSAAASISYSLGSTSGTFSATTSFQTFTTALTSLGSPASVTSISFTNKGTATVTVYIDNVRFL